MPHRNGIFDEGRVDHQSGPLLTECPYGEICKERKKGV
jgi:hypothetical protein